ncbi:MAG: hypothetical protein QXL94_04270 [Candidatus Parvarchaeum sp.]
MRRSEVHSFRKYDEDEDNPLDDYIVRRGSNGIIYTCKVCGRNFSDLQSYLKHKHDSSSVKREDFPEVKNLVEEMLSVYNSKKQDVVTAVSTLVSKGKKSKDGNIFYECPFGDTGKFKSSTLLEYHILKSHKDWLKSVIEEPVTKAGSVFIGRSFTSTEIDKMIDELAAKSMVRVNKNGVPVYRCPYHKGEIVGLDAFKKHFLTQHGEIRLAMLLGKIEEENPEALANEIRRNVRIRNAETGKNYYRCPICGYYFETPQAIEEHLLNKHSSEERLAAANWIKRKDYI